MKKYLLILVFTLFQIKSMSHQCFKEEKSESYTLKLTEEIVTILPMLDASLMRAPLHSLLRHIRKNKRQPLSECSEQGELSWAYVKGMIKQQNKPFLLGLVQHAAQRKTPSQTYLYDLEKRRRRCKLGFYISLGLFGLATPACIIVPCILRAYL